MSNNELIEKARAILQSNDFGTSTRPAPRLYPHQWLWDSCFIAIGLRHDDPARAVAEVESLFLGQWKNGMLPHIIFNKTADYHAGPDMWASEAYEDSPDDLQTSCITQPPVVAEAMVKVGEELDDERRQAFYARNIQRLVAYHAWMYRERDPDDTGLVTLIHAWECGTEDAPHWSEAMKVAAPDNVVAARERGSFAELDAARVDLKHAPLEQRPSSEDFYTLYHTFKLARQADFKLAEAQAKTKIPLIRDILFNAILCRANHHLKEIAAEIGYVISDDLIERMDRTYKVFAGMVDSSSDGQIFSIDHRTGAVLPEAGISNLMALYAVEIGGDKAAQLEHIMTSLQYWPRYGVATTPTDSPFYSERRFWQGPVWVSTNWLLYEGALLNHRTELAQRLIDTTVAVVRDGNTQDDSIFENYSAKTAAPGGTRDFSWSSALFIDMMNR